MKKLITLLLVLSMLTLLATGCGSSPQPASSATSASSVAPSSPAPGSATSATPPTASSKAPADLPVLRIGLQPYLLALPTVYIKEKGWDVQAGFKIETQVYSNGTILNEALGGNLWDLGTGGSSAVFGIANFNAKVIADISGCSGGTGAYIRPDHPAAKIKGTVNGFPDVYGNAATLKGAKVLVPVGTLNHLNVLKWLQTVGVKPEEVQVVHMDNSAAFQAFKAGQGDITAFSPPLTFQAEKEGWINGAGLDQLHVTYYDPLLANPRTYNEKKDIIVKYLKLMYKANDEMTADTNKTAEMLVKWSQSNALQDNIENAKITIKNRPFVTTEQAKKVPVGTTMVDMAKFFNSVGKLDNSELAKIEPNLTNEIKDLAIGK